MSKIISISNQKGGVGKTTTAVNLSAALAMSDKKTLIIDFDPQTNATSGLGVEVKDDDNTIMDVLFEKTNIKNAITKTKTKNLDLIIGDIELSTLETEFLNKQNREKVLKNILDTIKNDYDFIIIDCPPSLGILTVNALVASDSVIVPVQCEYFSLEGLAQVLDVIDLIKQKMNPNLTIEGILFTMFDGRTKLAQDVVKNINEGLKVKSFKTIISRNVRLAEAPSNSMTIFEYDPYSSGAKNYKNLANEILSE